MSGKLTYWVSLGGGSLRAVRLTICSEDDRSSRGVTELRRRKLRRLLSEASLQGVRLSYRDLSLIMLASKATLKRDVSYLRKLGIEPFSGVNN